MDEREELLKKIRILEEQIEYYKAREAQMEQMLAEYNALVKKQFELYDDFVKDIGTSRIIDSLTRTYNMEHMSKLISYYHQKAFEENRSYAVILVRLVDKNNDFEKHLIQLGKFLKSIVRVPMDSVGRFSDDTFIVLLTEITKENALKVAERIKNGCVSAVPCHVKVACRVYPDDEQNLENMIESLRQEIA
ncbi:diguanylate cyclase domain-containing protein [Pseudothermotoga thermarum]|uniref:GGDEF domain containing protein n=1 Tax=Pseudothermotoga thermarum DSM 5069 TaxID=688269 RepID=F7YUW1_9THEM|nr:diguanylate cyclase [Pseudothermotoga thermarum]AEH51521.1 GGDEF domain containing protein [Pseudothermotoga thermarum DSM 5069]